MFMMRLTGVASKSQHGILRCRELTVFRNKRSRLVPREAWAFAQTSSREPMTNRVFATQAAEEGVFTPSGIAVRPARGELAP
jgi:hypothetical protein